MLVDFSEKLLIFQRNLQRVRVLQIKLIFNKHIFIILLAFLIYYMAEHNQLSIIISFLLLLATATSLNNFCEQTQLRFGITFCIKCLHGYKSSSFTSCVPCEQNDFSFQCASFISKTQLQAQPNTSTSQNTYSQPNPANFFTQMSAFGFPVPDPSLLFSTKTVDASTAPKDFTQYFGSLPQFKLDQNCSKRDFFGRCTECKLKYVLNKQNGLCQIGLDIPLETKLKSLKCLIFSQRTNKCVKCEDNYGLKIDGSCALGVKAVQTKEEDIYGALKITEEPVKKPQNHFATQDIDLPLKANMISSFPIQEKQNEEYFLISQKYLTSEIIARIDKLFKGNNKCKNKIGKKCIECEEGYIINYLYQDYDELACQKINQPVVKFIEISKDEEVSEKQIESLITQHLTKYTDPYNDENCLVLSSESNSIKCSECIARYYYSETAQKCIPVDINCLKYEKKTGKCYFCKFGYITKGGICTLLNRNNFESGFKTYMNSPTSYFKDAFPK